MGEGHLYSSPAKSSSSENWFVVGFWQEKFPSVSGVRVNIISWLFCPGLAFGIGRLSVPVLTKKFALGTANWLSRSLTHLNVMLFSLRTNVSTVHLANVQKNERSRSNNNTNCAWRLLAAIAIGEIGPLQSRPEAVAGLGIGSDKRLGGA